MEITLKMPKLSTKQIGVILAFIAALVFPLLMAGRLPIFYYSFLFVLFLYIVFAENLNIIVGYIGYVNFGHCVFFGIGAYFSGILMRDYNISPFLTAGLAGLAAGAVALALGFPVLRLRGIYFGFATISLWRIFDLAANILPFTGGPLGIMLPLVPFTPITTELVFYVIMISLAATAILINYKIERSPFHYGLIAIRESEDAAETLGVNTFKLKMTALFISAVPTGVVGGIYAYYMNFIDPTSAFSYPLAWFSILMVILGGRATVTGPLVGAAIYFVTSEMLRYSFGVEYEGLHLVIFAFVLIVVVLFMRGGIVGTIRKKIPSLRSILI